MPYSSHTGHVETRPSFGAAMGQCRAVTCVVGLIQRTYTSHLHSLLWSTLLLVNSPGNTLEAADWDRGHGPNLLEMAPVLRKTDTKALAESRRIQSVVVILLAVNYPPQSEDIRITFGTDEALTCFHDAKPFAVGF